MAFDKVSRWIALLGLALLLGACAGTRGGPIAYDQTNFGVPDAPVAVPSEAAYKLAPLDTVSMTVFQVPDLSQDYTIDLSGKMTVPLIGQIDAVGMTPSELASSVQKKLEAKYLQDPNVVIALKSSARRVVTVDGSVRQPGSYPAIGPLTLIQAISLARGTDDLANPRRVAIFRMIDGQRKAAAFDLTAIRRGKSPDPAVYAGDTIIVDGSGVKKTQRDILQSLPLASIFLAL